MPTTISKSTYLKGLQCSKYLWIYINDNKKIPEPDKNAQFRFDQGHQVGELAKKLFLKGIDIPFDDIGKNIKQTQDLLKKRKPLFEPALSVDDIYARADILNPVGKDEWDIIEVKSSASVKDVYVQDVAFQKYCFEKAGLKIRKCFILHINTSYIKKGKIDPKKIFTKEEITEEVKEEIKGIDERIKAMQKMLSLNNCPKVIIGKQCSDPYDCPLMDYCWKFLPKNSVFDLYWGGKSEELLDRGILAIKDIPDDFKLSDKQQIQRECEKKNKCHIHKESIKHFLNTLHYPMYFLDFETVGTAIPLYDGTKPYQQVPFQFSLHVLQADGTLSHHEFLASGKADPRKELLKALKNSIGDKGSVIAYNACFEISRLKEMYKAYPKERWIPGVIDRVVDLLVPFRNFSYYNPKQQGSCSMKEVLPALVGKGYEDIDIAQGGDATITFLDMTFGKVSVKDQMKMRKDLLEYCGRDTEGMVWIVDELRKETLN